MLALFKDKFARALGEIARKNGSFSTLGEAVALAVFVKAKTLPVGFFSLAQEVRFGLAML